MEKVDILINARWVIPVEPDVRARDHWSVAIHHGRVVDVLPTARALERYAADKCFERPRHALLPGLINAHTHAAMSLMRGIADDLPLMDWLKDHIWPAERRWVSAEMVADGTELAVAEMLRSGTTCFNDMYFFPEVSARIAARLGIRASIGMIVLDAPNAWAETAAECLAKGLELRDEYRDHPLISTTFAPHAPYTVSDESLVKIRRLSDELDVPIHTHLHETDDEITHSVAQHGERPLARFARLGMLTPLLEAVHMTHLDESELAGIAGSGLSVVHAPESNMKLASGACPVVRLLDAGVNVALGTDGAASNNDLDMIGEMRSAALLAKHVTGSAAALGAGEVLRMATLNGATALGLQEQTGSLTAGKWADMFCIDLARIATQPIYDTVSQIVYAATREQVTDTWIAGRHLLADGVLTAVDEADLIRRAGDWQARITAAQE
jgi:5-methylthioadenosine/S-adenosylhomocysteine deaminase